MDHSTSRKTPARERLTKTFRSSLLAGGLIIFGGVMFWLLDQIRNRLSVTNLSSSSITIDELVVSENPKPPSGSAVVLSRKDLVVGPHQTMNFYFRPERKRHLSASGRQATMQWSGSIGSWGFRGIVTLDNRSMSFQGSSSWLRRWVLNNRNWIPLPSSYFD